MNMTNNKWREDLDLVVEKNLNELILETKEFDYAISQSKDKSKAQIWTALALINMKLNKLIHEKKTYDKKISKEEVDSIVKTLEKL